MDAMSSLRQRKIKHVDPKNALKLVKELDAFSKVPDSYQEKTASGGGISILTFLLIAILVYSEFKYHTTSRLNFDYHVDTDHDAKMKINVDIVVAMKCSMIGADILDVTNQDAHSFGQLSEEPTYFELSKEQRRVFDSRKDLNRYLSEQYHAIHDLLWISGYQYFFQSLPPREDTPTGEPDACRLYGDLEVSKVAGNFHVTAGKSVPVIPRGHAHLSLFLQDSDYNFSHRINHFSFGDSVSGIINPLDGQEMVTHKNYHIFQYFLQVVPTEVKTRSTNLVTYQYAVNEKNRSIDHSKGSHGIPGIFMKFDISPIKIRVLETHHPYWQFLVRLCGIVGGVFSVSGIIHIFVSYLINFICCRKAAASDRKRPLSPTVNPLVEMPGTNHQPYQSANLIVPEFSVPVT